MLCRLTYSGVVFCKGYNSSVLDRDYLRRYTLRLLVPGSAAVAQLTLDQ